MSARKSTATPAPTQPADPMAPRLSEGELVLYPTEDGSARFYLRAEDGTVWLTQAELAELFQTSKQNISLHIKNILTEGEQAESTVKFYLTVQTEGERRVRREGQISHDRMQLVAHERYAEFDAKRRKAEALAADAEDIKALEAVEKRSRKGREDAS